jgi:hypothetical protein
VKRAAKVQLVFISPNFFEKIFQKPVFEKNLFFETGCKDMLTYSLLPNFFSILFSEIELSTFSQNFPSFTGLQMYHGVCYSQHLNANSL